MKDSAFKSNRQLFLIIMAITMLIFLPLYYSVNSFFLNSTDEIINTWYKSEKISMQQGNILSSISKLQRPIANSILLKGIVVKDENGHDLVRMGQNFNIDQTINTTNNEPQHTRTGLSNYIYHFTESGIIVYILVGSHLPYIVALGFAIYLILLFIIFGYFIKREATLLEKIKNERELESMRLKMELDKNFLIMSRQVSHDIRSPLAALKMIMDDSDDIPKTYQQIIIHSIQRINDIANNLLKKDIPTSQNQFEQSNELLIPVIDTLVSEKRIMYRHSPNLKIEFEHFDAHDIFSRIHIGELKRVLSNLINNSVEAIFENQAGHITISLTKNISEKKALITISDNGKGMTPEIMKKLGEKNFTSGKDSSTSGFGLGFFHAKNTIESFKGIIDIESAPHKGTRITISLPLEIPPNWFLSQITIKKDSQIIVVDDDTNMHKAWSEKLQTPIIVFTTPDEFKNYLLKNENPNFLALIDYEFDKKLMNGLQVIRELKIEDKAVLVTSHYDEPDIQAECEREHIKLLPKQMASSIPIIHETKNINFFQAVYLENDELLRILWEQKAKKKSIHFLAISSIDSFEKNIKDFNKDETEIYIDNHLDNGGPLGVEFAQILHERGFKKLFLATGENKENFLHLPWLSVIGKECPF